MFSKNIPQSILVLIITLTNSINCETILDQALTTDNEVCKIVKQKLVCSKVTTLCPTLGCDQYKEITYDSNLNTLKANSFSNYEIKDQLTINLNNLKRIERDAFNGLILNTNAQLNINILNLDFDQEKTSDQTIKSNLIIETNALRDMLIASGAKLVIRIKNFDLVEFKGDSLLSQMKQSDQSKVDIQIETSNHVVFRSSLNKRDSNLNGNPLSSQFKLNITKCNEIVFDKESFAEHKQSAYSLFQIIATDFEHCRLGRLSFSQIKQSESSYYEINLTGKRLTLSEQTFSSLQQAINSNFITYFNISESNVCVKSKTFSDINQASNSTVRISFNLREENDFIIKKEAISNLVQKLSSHFQLYVLKPNDVHLEEQSVLNLTQNKLSFFEIWVSKAKANFLIQQNAFFKVKQGSEATIRLGFSSSLNGYFYQSPLAFNQLTSDSASQVIYDITTATNFTLRFPPRPTPRIMPMNLNGTTMEEALYRMFPNLGRQSRPDLISLNDYKIEANDFCRINEIPFDVLVKLRPDTDCSCSVYYLYRLIRRIRNDTDKWVLNTPDCYQKKISQLSNHLLGNFKSETVNDQDLKSLETMCNFKEMNFNCKQQTASNANPFEASKKSDLKDCDSSFDYFDTNQYSSNDETYVYEIDSETDTDDEDDESQENEFSNFSYDDKARKEDYVEEDYEDGYYIDEDGQAVNDDNRLIKPIQIEQEDLSKTDANIKVGLKLSTIHVIFISILSMILIAILISVFIVFRLNKREQSVPTNDEGESDDDDDFENDGDDNDLVTKSSKQKSVFKPIKNKLEKQKKKFIYTMFNKQCNSGLSTLIPIDSDNKSLVVQCNGENSITSCVTTTTIPDFLNQERFVSSLIVNEKNELNKTENKIYNQNENAINYNNSEIDAKIKSNYNIYN